MVFVMYVANIVHWVARCVFFLKISQFVGWRMDLLN